MGIALATSALLMLWFSAFFGLLEPKHKQHTVSAFILGAAGFVYCILTACYSLNPEMNLRPIRYIDWAITVPMLVYQMFMLLSFSQRKKSSLTTSIVCVILMLVFGWIGELGIGSKTILGLLGSIFGFYTFMVMVNGIQKRDNKFFMYIGIVWTFYPVVYFLLPGQAVIGYAVADVLAKIGSALYLLQRVRSYDEERS